MAGRLLWIAVAIAWIYVLFAGIRYERHRDDAPGIDARAFSARSEPNVVVPPATPITAHAPLPEPLESRGEESLPEFALPRVIDIPVPVPTPAACAKLSLIVRSTGGESLGKLSISLSCDGASPFEVELRDEEEAAEVVVAGKWLGRSQEFQGIRTDSFLLTEDGRLTLAKVAARRSILYRLQGQLDIPLAEGTISALEAGETREVPLVVELPRFECRGIVVDRDGKALAGAGIELTTSGMDALGRDVMGVETTRTDGEGRFAVVALPVERVHLLVTKAGYLSEVLEDLDTRNPDLRIVLQRGKQVTVSIVDARGEPVDVESIVANLNDGRPGGDAKRTTEGHYVFAGLPRQHVSFDVHIGGLFFRSLREPSLEDEVTVVLPECGQVEASWSLPPGTNSAHTLLCLRREHSQYNDVWSRPIPSRSGTLRMEWIPPGIYELTLSRMGRGRGHDPITAPTRVEVRAGETATGHTEP